MTVKLYCKYGTNLKGSVVDLDNKIEKALVEHRLADFVEKVSNEPVIPPIQSDSQLDSVKTDEINLVDLTVEQIESLILDITDVETLNEMLEDEKSDSKPRAGAIKAIESRIKEVSGNGESV